MKTNVFSVFILVFFLACGCVTTPSKPDGGTEGIVEKALVLAASEKVTRIQIFYTPEDVFTGIPLDENGVEYGAWAEVSVAQVQISKLRARILPRLEKSSMKPTDHHVGDYRWGIVFYDKGGKRLVSVYLVPNGYGSINGVHVQTDNGLLEFLRQQYRWLDDNW